MNKKNQEQKKQKKPVKLLLASLIATVLLSACANPQHNTAAGTAVGAAVGAGIGNLIGKNRKGTLIGAGVGAVIGGTVGYQWGAQIRQALMGIPPESGVTVADVNPNQPNSPIVVTLPEKVTFDSNSSYLKSDQLTQTTLAKISQAIQSQPYSKIAVVGHADSSGNPSKNQILSQERAMAVSSYLSRSGVDIGRINTQGMGANQPIADNSTPMGRAQNRRVEIIIYPSAATPAA